MVKIVHIVIFFAKFLWNICKLFHLFHLILKLTIFIILNRVILKSQISYFDQFQQNAWSFWVQEASSIHYMRKTHINENVNHFDISKCRLVSAIFCIQNNSDTKHRIWPRNIVFEAVLSTVLPISEPWILLFTVNQQILHSKINHQT